MIRENLRWMASMLLAANLALVAPGAALAGDKDNKKGGGGNDNGGAATETPIKHVVVIFQENVSFDHYFGTYPDAENLSEETKFKAKKDTPTVNGFTAASSGVPVPTGFVEKPHRRPRFSVSFGRTFQSSCR